MLLSIPASAVEGGATTQCGCGWKSVGSTDCEAAVERQRAIVRAVFPSYTRVPAEVGVMEMAQRPAAKQAGRGPGL